MSQWAHEHPEEMEEIARLPMSQQNEALRSAIGYDPDRIRDLAKDAGIDTSVCEICEEPLDDSEPWRRGMDGCGAHESCLTLISKDHF